MPTLRQEYYSTLSFSLPSRSFRSKTTGTMSPFPPPSLKEVLTEVTSLLKSRQETISVAETVCTHPSAIIKILRWRLPFRQGCGWHHLRIRSLHSRRKWLLQGRPYPLHPRIPRRLCRLDGWKHQELQWAHTRDCGWTRGKCKEEAGIYVYNLWKWDGRADGREHEE